MGGTWIPLTAAPISDFSIILIIGNYPQECIVSIKQFFTFAGRYV